MEEEQGCLLWRNLRSHIQRTQYLGAQGFEKVRELAVWVLYELFAQLLQKQECPLVVALVVLELAGVGGLEGVTVGGYVELELELVVVCLQFLEFFSDLS